MEWAVGIETRLDSIPENVLHDLTNPVVVLGTNWLASFGNPTTMPLEATAVPTGPVFSLEAIAEYRKICDSIARLTQREQELLIQFTPENRFAKDVHEQILSAQRTRRQFEKEHAGIAHTELGDAQNETQGN